jgi:hypothetical protein
VRDAFLCCVFTGHYLATSVSLPPQFLLWANTPKYTILLWTTFDWNFFRSDKHSWNYVQMPAETLSCKLSVLLLFRFNCAQNLPTDFDKTSQYISRALVLLFSKWCMRTNGWIDMTKLMVSELARDQRSSISGFKDNNVKRTCLSHSDEKYYASWCVYFFRDDRMSQSWS